MNDNNLTPFTSEQSREQAVRNGKKGGLMSGEAKRQKKQLAEAIREVLYSANPETSNPLINDLVTSVLQRVVKRGTAKDLKDLADILGELTVKNEVTTVMPNFSIIRV